MSREPHAIFASALAGVGPKRRPAEPPHLGGAVPLLSHREHLLAARFLVLRVAKYPGEIEREILTEQLLHTVAQQL